MRQVVRAPFRHFVPHLLGGTTAAFAAFILGFVTNMVININDTSLVLRDEIISLDLIVQCTSVDGPPEELNRNLGYKIKTPGGMICTVPGKLDSLVQVTLNNGQRVTFSTECPGAVIQALQGRCKHLRQ